MHIALCLVQAGLAMQFINHGWFYLNMPAQVQSFLGLPEALRLFIGVAEIAGGVGLVVPPLVRVLPVLTPLAALGLAAIGFLAAGFHVMRGEFGSVPNGLSLALIALGVAYARGKVEREAGR